MILAGLRAQGTHAFVELLLLVWVCSSRWRYHTRTAGGSNAEFKLQMLLLLLFYFEKCENGIKVCC